jgi:hypothetical protein
VVFTSGATGPAKGVRYTFGQLCAQRDAVQTMYGITPDDRFVAAFAPFAVFGPALVGRGREPVEVHARGAFALGDERTVETVHLREIDLGRFGEQPVLGVGRELFEESKNLRLSGALKGVDQRVQSHA